MPSAMNTVASAKSCRMSYRHAAIGLGTAWSCVVLARTGGKICPDDKSMRPGQRCKRHVEMRFPHDFMRLSHAASSGLAIAALVPGFYGAPLRRGDGIHNANSLGASTLRASLVCRSRDPRKHPAMVPDDRVS
jgi:hypothetical protein